MEKNKPCRDYEEQGFCVYGETCQYSHGTNPVVLDGVNAGLILTSTVSTTATTGSTTTISTTHQSRSNKGMNTRSGMKKRLGSSGFSSSGQHRNNSDGGLSQNHHNNNRHHNNSNSGSSNNTNNNNHQQHQNHNHNHNNNSNHNHNSSGINYRHSGSNTHHRHSNNNNNNSTQQNTDKCKLEVKRIPQHQNTIKDLNEHFSKFGTVVNIQVNYEGDPEGALIQYSSPHEAIAAYRSPEAVFNNRFIRVHWHFKSDLSNANHEHMHDNNSSKRSFNTDINEDETIKNNSKSTIEHTTNKKAHHQSIQQQHQQQQQINRAGKKRSVLMRLGAKSASTGKNTSSTKSNNNQTTNNDANDDNSKLDDDDDDDNLNDEPPAKQAPNDPDGLNLASTFAANKPPIKSRRELNLHNKQQQDINNASNNKKKVQKQGVEIQRKQSDLLTNLIHQQKILIKKIESSTEEKERASLKSILDELTQKTKDLMTKTSLKQSIIRSNQPTNQPIVQAQTSSSASATTASTPTTASSANATTDTTTTATASVTVTVTDDAQDDTAKTDCPLEPGEGRDNSH